MAQEGRDTERTSVKTYIPVYQREEWERHAEQLDMSRSEFVRTMVQVGRRSFDGEATPTANSQDVESESRQSTDATREDLEDHVVEVLSEAGTLSWDDLVAELTNDVEERLEASLDRLQRENVVQYAGRDGGYKLTDGGVTPENDGN